MRKIKLIEILIFLIILFTVIILSYISVNTIFSNIPLQETKGVLLVLLYVLTAYAYSFLFFRLFLKLFPLDEGEIDVTSKKEFIYHIYLLFYLIIFYPLIRSGFIPVPIMRIIYIFLEAHMGENTYSSGIILDPSFVSVGANTLIGQYSLLVPHVIEGNKLAHYPITIGNNVTIGAHSVVMSNVTIEDGAIIAMGAVITKNTRVGKNEMWGGVPAKKINRS